MSRAKVALTITLIGALAASATLWPTHLAQATSTPSTTPPAPKPPLAYPGYVEQITTSSATLKGSVNPVGSATQYFFQYGPTTAYGSQTPSASAGSGTQIGKVIQPVSGLEPGTTYHFRVVASSPAGTTDSADATFTTKKIPLSLIASATPDPVVIGSSLTLSGTLSGTGNASVQIVLQGNPFPYASGFHNITSPELTNAAGGFSFPIAGLLESTHLRAATLTTPAVLSPVITELVTVRVTLHVRPDGRRGFVRLYGTVTPAEQGARVAFEHFEHSRYVLVGGTRIRHRGSDGGTRFAGTIPLRRRGRYRALVIASGPQVSGRSRPVIIR